MFSKSDFISDIRADSIDKALSELAKEKKIRRIARGMYDYPKYSNLLNKYLSPDIDEVAHAMQENLIGIFSLQEIQHLTYLVFQLKFPDDIFISLMDQVEHITYLEQN